MLAHWASNYIVNHEILCCLVCKGNTYNMRENALYISLTCRCKAEASQQMLSIPSDQSMNISSLLPLSIAVILKVGWSTCIPKKSGLEQDLPCQQYC